MEFQFETSYQKRESMLINASMFIRPNNRTPPLIRRTPPNDASFEGVYALFGALEGVYDYLGDSSIPLTETNAAINCSD